MAHHNTVEVAQLPSPEPFRGIAVLEVAIERSTQELMQALLARSVYISDPKNISTKPQGDTQKAEVIPEEPKCGVCTSVKDLLRCSRCKTEWYCGEGHQRQHWPVHKKVCGVSFVVKPEPLTPFANLQPTTDFNLKPIKAEADSICKQDSDVVEMNTILSLVCPLSISRIITPVKGIFCTHDRCFDLETFLEFSGQSNSWQCPMCYSSCTLDLLRVDERTQRILKDVDSEVTQVRVLPNGAFEPIKDEEDDSVVRPRAKRSKKIDPVIPAQQLSLQHLQETFSLHPQSLPPPSHPMNTQHSAQESTPQPDGADVIVID